MSKYTRADFEPLLEAEKWIFGKGFDGAIDFGEKLPDENDQRKTIRAKLIRALVLDQIEGVEIGRGGVLLIGVVISGGFDLSWENLDRAFAASNCIFLDDIFMQDSKFQTINLESSSLNNVFLNGSRISGNLFLDFAIIGGSLMLNGAHIERNFSAMKCKFVSAGSKITAVGLQVYGSFIWQSVTCASELVLSEAKINTIIDDRASWPEKGKLHLRGMTFNRFQGGAPTSARDRLEWLSRMSYFHPQPYKEVARVMRESGDDAEARAVLYEMEWLQARELKSKTAQKINYLRHGGGKSIPIEEERYHGETRMVSVERILFEQFGRNILNWATDVFVGYGYKIERALFWYIGLVTLLAVLSFGAYRNGQMAPNAAPILVSAPYVQIDNPYEWANSGYAADWEDFSAVVYGLDVVTPIINFGQTDAWAPSTRGTWGWILWWLRWPVMVLGWIIASFVASSVTGVIQKRHGS